MLFHTRAGSMASLSSIRQSARCDFTEVYIGSGSLHQRRFD